MCAYWRLNICNLAMDADATSEIVLGERDLYEIYKQQLLGEGRFS